MNLVGHHAGTLMHATYYPSIPRQPTMRIFDQPIWSVKSSIIAITAYQTDEEREIAALKERVQKLQSQLDSYDRLFRFAGRISKKLICIGQMSDTEIISALKFGIDIRVDNTRYSFRLPVWKIDNHTMVDQEFLRLNGELKDFKDVSCQFPPNEEGVVEISTITLHKGESLFSENSDASFLDEFGRPMYTNLTMTGDFVNTDEEVTPNDSLMRVENVDDTILMDQIGRIKSIKSSMSQRLRDALASAKDITRLASEIAQHVSNANNSRIALVGTVSEARGGISEASTVVEQTEAPTRPSTKNRTGIPVRVQVPPQIEYPLPGGQGTATSPGNVPNKFARPTGARAGPNTQAIAGPSYQTRYRQKEPVTAGPKAQAIAGPKDQAIAGPSQGKTGTNTGMKENKRTGARSCDHVTHAKGKIIPRKTHTPFKYSRPKVAITKGIRRPFNRFLPPAVAAIQTGVLADPVPTATIPADVDTIQEVVAGISAAMAEILVPGMAGPAATNNPPGQAPINPNIDPRPAGNSN